MSMEWLSFDYVGPSKSGKTSIWQVNNKVTGGWLGEIKWHGPWRKYCFFPLSGTLFEQFCLIDIAWFLDKATEDHKTLLEERR